jgi:hypothetical protein
VSVVGTKGIIVVAVTDGPFVLGAGRRGGDSAHQKDIVVLLLPHCGMATGGNAIIVNRTQSRNAATEQSNTYTVLYVAQTIKFLNFPFRFFLVQ